MKQTKIFLSSLATTAIILFSNAGTALAQISAPDIGQVGGKNLKTIIISIGNWALGIAGAIAVVFLIYGGILYITGGEKGAEAGKKILINAIIGLAIIALAGFIVRMVIDVLGA